MHSTIANGSLYEDKFDVALEYVTQSGIRQNVSQKKGSGIPTSTNYLYLAGDVIINNNPVAGGLRLFDLYISGGSWSMETLRVN